MANCGFVITFLGSMPGALGLRSPRRDPRYDLEAEMKACGLGALGVVCGILIPGREHRLYLGDELSQALGRLLLGL